MRVERCKTEYLICDDTLEVGDWINSKGGSWHLVLAVLGEGYTQSTNGRSIQSMNQPKSKQRIGIFDGTFYGVKDFNDVCVLYDRVYRPNKTDVEKELFNNLKTN